MKPTKFNVSDASGAAKFIVHGTASETILTLAFPYPNFDVEAGWTATGGGLVLTFTGPRDGQAVPCTRG